MALALTCPAAEPVHRLDTELPGCVCRVLVLANEGEEIGGWTQKGQVSPVVDPRQDPSSIVAFCAGDYTGCPIWRAEKERVWAGRPVKGGLHSEQHRPPNPGREAALEQMMSGMRRGRSN